MIPPININSTVAQTCLNITGSCGQALTIDDVSNIQIHISKAGSCGDPILTYPALGVKDGKVCFFWDHNLYDLPSGRYKGQIVIDDECCDILQLQIGEPCGISGVVNHEFKGGCNEC